MPIALLRLEKSRISSLRFAAFYNISYISQLYLQKAQVDCICFLYVQIYKKDIVST